MTQISSAFSSDSLLLSVVNASSTLALDCLTTEPVSSVFATFTITNVLLLLPLCLMVLYNGLQRWQQQRSSSKPTATSHSDSFTYHLVAIQLFNVFGSIFCFVGTYQSSLPLLLVWFYLFSFTWYAETFFHLLTCVERYLAVVHPITYFSLRQERGIRMRNISIGCIWLLCFGGISVMSNKNVFVIVDLCLLITSVAIVSFCSLCVLRVLIRPGPGEQGRDRVKVDQSKQRAFCTILAILGVLLLRCSWNLVWTVMDVLNIGINQCLGIMCEVWFNFPSSLVLPLLFLQRTGALVCCKNRIK